jgi:PBSX family phage terminase large subunit
MPTGARIIFEGADNIGKVLGGAQHISFFNEVTEFSKQVYLQITQRTSGKVICDYNPSKDFWLEKYRFDKETVFIHSDFRDNAFCPQNIIKQLLSYEPWLPGSYDIVNSEIIYKGKPLSQKNQPPPNVENIRKGTADEYMWMVYGLGIGAEKPNRIYKGWKKISQEDFDELPYDSYFGVDFGAKNPTAIVEVKYDGDGNFYICKRYYKALTDITKSINTVISEDVPQIRLGYSLIVGDSAKKDYIDILRNRGHLAVGAKKGNNSVSPGITTVQSCSIYYVEDEDMYQEYSTYSWKLDRYEKSTDEPEKKDDHLMDAIRYIITYLIEYLGIEI